MHVGVEEAVAQGVAKKGLDQATPQRGRIKAELGQTDRDRSAARRRSIPSSALRAWCGPSRSSGRGGPGRRRGSRQIPPPRPLRAGNPSPCAPSARAFRRLRPAAAGEGRREAFGHSGGEKHVGEVARESPFDAGPQHLDRDFALAVAVAHAGAMHLGDRGGGHRRRRNRRRRLASGASKAASTCATAISRGSRRHAVLQPLQLRRDLGSDDVGPGREKLSELDVGRTQPIDRAGEAGEAGHARAAPAGSRRPARAGRAAAARAGRRRQRRLRAPARTRRARAGGRVRRTPEPPISELPARMNRDDAAGQSGVSRRARSRPRAIMSANRSGVGNCRIDSTR